MRSSEFIFEDGGQIYHVTFTKYLTKIVKQGIRPLQPSNWTKAANPDERYNTEGGIFAFEHPWDAYKWAFEQNWQFKEPVSIIKLRRNENWEKDPSEDYRLQMGKGAALRSSHAVSLGDIIKIYHFEDFKSPVELGMDRDEWEQMVIKTLQG